LTIIVKTKCRSLYFVHWPQSEGREKGNVLLVCVPPLCL